MSAERISRRREDDVVLDDLRSLRATAPPPYLPCELYGAWQSARDDTDDAYAAWCAAPGPAKAEGYAVYRAAADREQVAEDLWLRA